MAGATARRSFLGMLWNLQVTVIHSRDQNPYFLYLLPLLLETLWSSSSWCSQHVECPDTAGRESVSQQGELYLSSNDSQCIARGSVGPQSRPTLCSPMDCSPPGFSVHGILQARILEGLVIPFSRGSSRLRSNPHLQGLLHWQLSSLLLSYLGSPCSA